MYAYTCIYTRVWLYICTPVGLFCLFILSISLLHACVSQVFFNTCMRAWEGIGSGFFFNLFMVSACCWLGSHVLAEKAITASSCIFPTFVGVRVVGRCVLVCARTHTQTTWVIDVSPGVVQTPGEPAESWSTKAQCTCRSYMSAKYVFLYICCAAGFDDLGWLPLLFELGIYFLWAN